MPKSIAQVVVGVPVEGPFDYILPQEMEAAVTPGCRVLVPFGPRTAVGYVVGITKETTVTRIKAVAGIIDTQPLLDGPSLELAKKLSEYYCCSWGEAIETMLY